MKTIFVVADDHPMVLDGVAVVLQSLDPEAEVLTAANYPELLDLLTDDLDVSLVLMDLNMPGMAGLDGVRAVQAKRPDVPLMIMSAIESKKAITKSRECGVVGYMFKSFNPEEMKAAVAKVLEGETFFPEANTQMFSTDEFSDDVAPKFGEAALNKLPMGVVIVDKEAQVLFMNAMAGDIFALSDGVDVGPTGVFRTSMVQETKALHAMIAEAIEGSVMAQEDQEAGAMIVSRPSLKRPFSLLVVPLLGENATEQDNVAVFINDPEKHNELSTTVLARLYGLTEAEARLLQGLILGKKLETVAAESSVSMNTVRSHLKQVFRKTGTNRQPELVSVVLNSSAYLASNPVLVAEDEQEGIV